jgi:phosphoglucomutase
VRDFRKDVIHDEEGDRVSKEKMLFVDLADGRSFAVRPSGTEPKIKYYMFAKNLWSALEKDIDSRLA